MIKWQIYKHTVKFNRDGLNTTEQRPRKIIASLTSYPARIEFVPYVVASLLKQTMKPDKIIIWLAESQFPDKKLPPLFDELKACGVEVRFCPEDIGPHKKYYYVMQEYPEDLIITFDDDIVYHNFVIETLYRSYLEHPECVSVMRADKINFLPDGNIAGYFTDFNIAYRASKYTQSFQFIASNGAGVLRPPHVLHEDAFNVKRMMEYCPKADDIWLKFMEVLKGTKVVTAWEKMIIPGFTILKAQNNALWDENGIGGYADVQIQKVLEAYSDWRDPSGRTLLEVIRDD